MEITIFEAGFDKNLSFLFAGFLPLSLHCCMIDI